MSFRDTIRTVVVKTNPYWPFSTLNKMPYALALEAFIQICKQFSEVKSLYLRHGLTQDDWLPAISDIDLTLIIDSHLSIEEEFTFLRLFWKRYDRLKKLFLMLGEVEILTEDQAISWTKFTIRGYEAKHWRLIYGRETVKSSYTVIPERLMLDALDYAWFCYQTFFLKKLYQWGPHSFLTSHEMQRLVGKILRYANYFDAGDGIQPTLKRSFSETADMSHCVLDAMGEGIRRLTSSPDFVRLRKRAERCRADIAYRSHPLTEPMLGGAELAPFRETVDSVWFVDNEKVIVVKDGVSAAEMRGCLDAVNYLLAPPESDIMVVSASIFRYMLQVSRPFLYMHLMVYGKVAHGQDVLSDLQPPAMSFFAYRVLEQTGTILTFPQSRTAILSSDSAWFFGRELASLLERALFLKMYLETGTIKPWYHELLEESRRRYPQYYNELQRLQENVDDVDDGTICRGSFRLLRSVTNDIHNHLKNDDMIANFFTNEATDAPLR